MLTEAADVSGAVKNRFDEFVTRHNDELDPRYYEAMKELSDLKERIFKNISQIKGDEL